MSADRRREAAENAENLNPTTYLPFVRQVASRIARRLPQNIEVDDLVSAGTLGLMEAIGRYDAAGGRSFETYAEFRIKGAIYDDLRRLDPVKRSSRALQNKLAKTQAELGQALGREPTREELAEALNTTIDDVEVQILRANRGEVSLRQDIAVKDERTKTPEELALRAQEIGRLKDVIATLGKKDQAVLNLYYVEELSLSEIGTVIGVSESRVCQILGQLRRVIKSNMQERASR